MASLEEVNLLVYTISVHLKSGLIRIMVFVGSGLIRGKPGEDPGFQVGGGTLKKIVPSGGRYFVWKITILRQKIIFFPILGGWCTHPPWIHPWKLLYLKPPHDNIYLCKTNQKINLCKLPSTYKRLHTKQIWTLQKTKLVNTCTVKPV